MQREAGRRNGHIHAAVFGGQSGKPLKSVESK